MLHSFKFLAAALLACPLSSFSNTSGNEEAIKKNAQACFGCHGKNGVSTSPYYPNLAGQKEKYIEQQLRLYKNGERKNDIMSAMAKSLSNEDITSLAKYFSNLD